MSSPSSPIFVPESSNTSSNTIIFIILGLLVVGGAVYYFFFRNKSAPASSSSAPLTQSGSFTPSEGATKPSIETRSKEIAAMQDFDAMNRGIDIMTEEEIQRRLQNRM